MPETAVAQHNKDAEAIARRYLRTFASARRILLYLEMTDPVWPADPKSAEMETALRSWWRWISTIIQDEGFKGEVAIYPIDEATSDQVVRLNGIITLLHKVAPGVPIYGTVGEPPVANALALDIEQVHERALASLASSGGRARERQLYATRYNAKTQSLSGYYRGLSWTAFSAELKGVGVWSMWDSSGANAPERSWSDFGGGERDFGLLYGDADGCVHASRRLLAFRRGIDDFTLFSACQPAGSSDVRWTVQAFLRRSDHAPEDYDGVVSALVRSCRQEP